jgi:hypothetical protein
MKLTIEIEPEEAAKFIKSIMPESVSNFYGPGLMDIKKSPADIWNETYTKWINAIKDQHADDKE